MMDAKSEAFLQKVHPVLCAIMRAAAQSPVPFRIVFGARTVEQEKACCQTGRSTTMHSRHIPEADGFARAVDVAALNPDGSLNWAEGCEEQVYGPIAQQVKAGAEAIGFPIEWGGDWISFKDYGHFQLPWKEYP